MIQGYFSLFKVAILLVVVLIGSSAAAQTSVKTESAPAKEGSGSLFEGVELNDEHIKAGEEFVVPGEFSIATPTGGFEWKELPSADERISGKSYACTRPGQKAGIVLGIELRTADSDAARLASIATNYNMLLVRLEQRGFTNPRVKKPSIETPVADRVEYEVTAKTPAGKESYMLGETIFGGRVFSFQVAAESRKEADELFSILKTFKDLRPPIDSSLRGSVIDNEFVVPGIFSIVVPAKGYEWGLAQTVDRKGTIIPTYACSKEGETSSAVVAMQSDDDKAETDLTRVTQQHFDLLKKQFKASGFSGIEGRSPQPDSSNAQRVSFALRGKDSKGQTTYVFGLAVKGRQTYLLHLISTSQEEARQLHSALKSFKELPPT